MGGDVFNGGGLIAVTQEELERQYRLIKQMVAMHYSLTGSSRRKARVSELSLLAASVVFLTTTFAGPEVFKFFNLSASSSKIVLGIASVVAFFFATALLIIDWAGIAARHEDVARRLSELLLKFREKRDADKRWPENVAEELSAEYQNINDSGVAIPDAKFNSLKAKYLTKVEISKLASDHPGAPISLLWIIVRLKGSYHAIRGSKRYEDA